MEASPLRDLKLRDAQDSLNQVGGDTLCGFGAAGLSR
ncbi:hypothetical protein PL9631_120034 [Planktothrix paucivesiculata PCC 9631]|uniref:Uncharacterized protein n=1 Tax=Planktothrix paucivesiculata PCC 9631 TaxID=671071 RepID=A0A7Z9DWK0_9CYAN|nr:hypothetical protein PL9631_120034 [Planktothrix paucivesiculata PCC 9631]